MLIKENQLVTIIFILTLLNYILLQSTNLIESQEISNNESVIKQKNNVNDRYEQREEQNYPCVILLNFIKKTFQGLYKFFFYGIDNKDLFYSNKKSKQYIKDDLIEDKKIGRKTFTWSNKRRKNYSDRFIKRRERVKRNLEEEDFKATDEEALLEEIWRKGEKKNRKQNKLMQMNITNKMEQTSGSKEEASKSESQSKKPEKEESFHRSDWTDSLPRISKYEFNTAERGDPNADDGWWTEIDRSKIRRQSNILKVPSM